MKEFNFIIKGEVNCEDYNYPEYEVLKSKLIIFCDENNLNYEYYDAERVKKALEVLDLKELEQKDVGKTNK